MLWVIIVLETDIFTEVCRLSAKICGYLELSMIPCMVIRVPFSSSFITCCHLHASLWAWCALGDTLSCFCAKQINIYKYIFFKLCPKKSSFNTLCRTVWVDLGQLWSFFFYTFVRYPHISLNVTVGLLSGSLIRLHLVLSAALERRLLLGNAALVLHFPQLFNTPFHSRVVQLMLRKSFGALLLIHIFDQM